MYKDKEQYKIKKDWRVHFDVMGVTSRSCDVYAHHFFLNARRGRVPWKKVRSQMVFLTY
jgi:hypothetical protein